MNCRNCGGAMELFADRGYFFCRYCGSFHFPETAGDDGIRLIGAGGPPLECPACGTALASALLDESYSVSYCQNCRGVLLPRPAFAEVVRQRRSWAAEPPKAPAPLDRTQLQRTVKCPACRRQMSTHPYYGPGNVVIDGCEACHLIWLDFGELRQIVDAPGRDRGMRTAAAFRPGTSAGESLADRRERSSRSGRVDLIELVSSWLES